MDEDGQSEDFETKTSDEESEFDEDSYSSEEEDSTVEVAFTDDEVQDLIDELLVVESKAAEAQEMLEEESLAALRVEIKEELSSNVHNDEKLDTAVDEEMNTYIEQWQETLDELEDQSSLLQESLDAAGVDLSDLFKWIEKQAPQGCSTEAWKRRTHWAGLNASDEVSTAIRKAEQDLNLRRPVKRHHGKSMEEGASGFLRKRFLDGSTLDTSKMEADGNDGWESMDDLFESGGDIEKWSGFGTKSWASVYLAATPEQAALLGVPGADKVEEIIDLDKCKKDFLTAAAIASEKETGFTEQQKRNIRKVGEEEDIKKTRMIDRFILQRKRKKKTKFDEGASEQTKASSAASNGGVKVSQMDVLQEPSQMCKTGEDSSFCLRNDRIIINIESDEEQVPNEVRKPGYCHEGNQFSFPDENGVHKTRTSMGMSNYPMEVDNKGKSFCKDIEVSRELAIVPHGFNSSQDGMALAIISKERDTDFMCTVCGEKLHCHQVHKHPFLSVIVCRSCRQSYSKARFTKDSTGSYNECCWCACGGNVIMCEHCDRVFCNECITLNFGAGELERIMSTEEWICYCCNNEVMKPKIESFRKANELSSTNFGGLDDDHFELRTNERRRKRLRRILDDDELEESTILKQKLERERKERLARLRESATNSSALPISSFMQECPINVARDADEEEVLIPFGIAKFLKPHQIEGVRFMWENCIESLKKVKSGDPGNGCILAHNMGLGKTLQVIAFLYTVLKRKDLGLRTALIVTPVNVLHNWPDEFEKWKPPECKKIRVYVLDEASRNLRRNLLNLWKKTGGVMMIGYTAFRTMSSAKHIKDDYEREAVEISLQNPGPDILVCDEAHMIKNKKADITQALKQVKTQRRIALTGSPLQNNLMEYYCMVDFVREGFLGRPQDFKNRFQNPIENGQHADSTEYDVRCMKERTHVLHKQLMGFVQRKGVNVVEEELPKKIIYVLSVRLSQLQRALYNRFVQYFWLSNEQPPLGAKYRKCLFPTYHALAKVWNHPNLLILAKEEKDVLSEDSMDDIFSEDGLSSEDENNGLKKLDKRTSQKASKRMESDIMRIIESFEWCKDLINDMDHGVLEDSGKFVLLLHILSMSSAKSEKVLVFSQSLPTLNLIESFLGKIPRPGGKVGFWRKDKEWYRLDGHTKARDRQKLVKRFNDPTNSKVQCVLISTKAGSLGINLQAANRVVIVDGSWNPTHDIQALFRAWRFGQKKPVFVYRLLAYGTAEEKIYKRQVAKEGLAARVLDAQQVERHSKMEELKILFKLDDDVVEFSEKQNMEDGSNEMCSSNSNNRGVRCSDQDAPEDDIMKKLMVDHSPKWIVRIHQHDTLLEDREEEKLTLEEQDLAWEKFKRITENTIPDWIDGESGPSTQCSMTYVQNSWANRVQGGLRSSCSTKVHAELLVNSDTKNNAYVKCDLCEQMIGWEHIVKGRAFIAPKK